jgi:hypothetical protein
MIERFAIGVHGTLGPAPYGAYMRWDDHLAEMEKARRIVCEYRNSMCAPHGSHLSSACSLCAKADAFLEGK